MGELNSNKKWIVVISLLGINLIAVLFLMLYIFIPRNEMPDDGSLYTNPSVQYILYIGTNDMDTYEQIIPVDEAVDIVNAIITKYAGGYTMQHARGGWVDETGTLTQENTIIYTIDYAEESDIIAIMDEVLSALNQNAILMEKRNVTTGFYYGEADR